MSMEELKRICKNDPNLTLLIFGAFLMVDGMPNLAKFGD